jgi:hypothetical protein
MNIALIIGCARSGTSILGELLAAHEDVEYVFEAHQVWEIAPPPPDASHRQAGQDATAEIKYQIRNVFSERLAKSNRKMIIEKCPKNTLRIPYLKSIFPEAKIVHIVRDGRDVACSLRPGLQDGWYHLKPPNWQTYAKEPLIERCAKTWRDVISIALRDLAKIDHLQIKYETLINNAASVISRLSDFLDLTDTGSMTEFARRIQDTTAESYQARHQSAWFRPDHRKRIGRWKENLNSDEKLRVNEILSPTLARLGY